MCCCIMWPATFHSFFTKVTSVYNYNTRFAAKHSYYHPYARTNQVKFNIRFQGPAVWNAIDDNVKLSSFSIITQVIIEILALSLAENGVIFRYNPPQR